VLLLLLLHQAMLQMQLVLLLLIVLLLLLLMVPIFCCSYLAARLSFCAHWVLKLLLSLQMHYSFRRSTASSSSGSSTAIAALNIAVLPCIAQADTAAASGAVKVHC
jgi:hypothetical protein